MIKITHKRGNKTIEETRPKYAWIMSHTYQLVNYRLKLLVNYGLK
jgi:hypothetical protein